MNENKLRILLLCSHPTQYGSPMWRRFAKHPSLDVLVAYCGMQGAELHVDPGFGAEVAWDVPLLDDYPWIQIRNISPLSSGYGFFSLINPGIWRLIRTGRFDAIAIFTGYTCASFWIALAAAKASGIPVMYGTDATTLQPVDGRVWKLRLKKWLWPRLFRMADVVFAPSSGTAMLMRSLNIPQDRIQITPYVVDNDWWIENAKSVDRRSVRAKWNVSENAKVILFCAKLQPWKRPADVLHAFHLANIPNSCLVFAGEGPLRKKLERGAAQLGISDRVRFLGFVNQSGLPAVYASCDVMVLPSEYEPFGVVVNEAMLCGCAVITSDKVGARLDLVREGKTGFTYRAGDVAALASVMSRIFECSARLRGMGEAARARMSEWSPEMNLEATVNAFERAIRHRSN
jgi:glycosyltransferase involved in cell wall biosynthesis